MNRRGLPFVMLAASLLALFLAALSGYENQSHARCQAGVNEALILAQRARSQAADDDRAALDRMVADVAQAHSAADTRAALARYRATRSDADAKRAANPLPDLPDQVCQ